MRQPDHKQGLKTEYVKSIKELLMAVSMKNVTCLLTNKITTETTMTIPPLPVFSCYCMGGKLVIYKPHSLVFISHVSGEVSIVKLPQITGKECFGCVGVLQWTIILWQIDTTAKLKVQ